MPSLDLGGEIAVDGWDRGLLLVAGQTVVVVGAVHRGGGLVLVVVVGGLGDWRRDGGGVTVLSSSSVLSLVRGAGQSFPLGGDLVVEAVEVLGGGAVEVEPPVADEVVLVEESSVGTEEAVLGQTSGPVSSTDVESLALSLGVSVVTTVNLAVTDEGGLWHLGVDGVVLPRDPGDVGGEGGQGGVVAGSLVGSHGVAGGVDRDVRVVRVVGGGVAFH